MTNFNKLWKPRCSGPNIIVIIITDNVFDFKLVQYLEIKIEKETCWIKALNSVLLYFLLSK